jgi:hypothetical protein
MIRMGLLKGTQIAYVPQHADSVNHPDVQLGFIVKPANPPENGYFCRYWQPGLKTLRTRANSELTSLDNLQEHMSVMSSQVWDVIIELDIK